MSKLTRDGGAAFPRTPSITAPAQEGLSMRDYFAAKAMAAIISNPYEDPRSGPMCMQGEPTIAEWAYAQADAMIEARGK